MPAASFALAQALREPPLATGEVELTAPKLLLALLVCDPPGLVELVLARSRPTGLSPRP